MLTKKKLESTICLCTSVQFYVPVLPNLSLLEFWTDVTFWQLISKRDVLKSTWPRRCVTFLFEQFFFPLSITGLIHLLITVLGPFQPKKKTRHSWLWIPPRQKRHKVSSPILLHGTCKQRFFFNLDVQTKKVFYKFYSTTLPPPPFFLTLEKKKKQLRCQ